MNGVAQVGDTSAIVTLSEDGNVLYLWQPSDLTEVWPLRAISMGVPVPSSAS